MTETAPGSVPISQDEILQLKTKMQAILFSIQEGIVMTDFEGHVLLLNDAAKRLLSIPQKYPYEKKFLDYVEDSWLKAHLKTVLESKEDTDQFEVALKKEDEETFLKITKNIVTTARGEILGRALAIRDVTLEKRLEGMKDEFVQSVTHDLKSPMSSLHGFVCLFLSGDAGPLTEDQVRYFKLMRHSTEKVLQMIHNILDSVKLEAGQMVLAKNDWEVVESVNSIVESLQGVAKFYQVRLYATVSPLAGSSAAPKIRLLADQTLVERVLGNLLDNALKFSMGGGEIEVIVQERPERVDFAVRDTGRGIPPQFLGDIFKKFKQVPGTKGGTGLGLNISSQIVRQHGGEISVESEPGRGATFRFWIPKQETGPS